jgi:hypothetical protein
MKLHDDYFANYRSLKLTRDADSVLVVEFHTKGGPFRFTAQDHTEFVDAFTGSPKIERTRLCSDGNRREMAASWPRSDAATRATAPFAAARNGEDEHTLTVPESRVVLRSTIRSSLDSLERGPAHLSGPP